MKTSRQSLITGFLVVIALLQMIGDILNQPWMKAMGAASGASPAPKVFSTVNGLETFSSRFFLVWKDKENVIHRMELTPKVCQGLQGPYNRRNVYGAVLSYGPILSKNRAMRDAYESVLAYAFTRKGELLKEIGIDIDSIAEGVSIEVVPRVEKSYAHLELIKEVSISQ
jgi:hypothetical protein